MENTNLDQNIEQTKQIGLALANCQLNSSMITPLIEQLLAKKLDENQVNSLKKMVKENVDFYKLVNLIDNTANQEQAKVENV
jgi:hypothetical protein